MTPSILMTGGVFWRLFNIIIPAKDDVRGPVKLLELMRASADWQLPYDEQMMRSQGNWLVGGKLVLIQNPILIFGPNANGSGVWTGTSLAAGRLWTPATQGDWTEAVTEQAMTTWLCSNTNGSTVTAQYIGYFKRYAHPVVN